MIDFDLWKCESSGDLRLERLAISYDELSGDFKYTWQVGWHAGLHSDGVGGTEKIPEELIKTQSYHIIANMINRSLQFDHAVVTAKDIKPIIESCVEKRNK